MNGGDIWGELEDKVLGAEWDWLDRELGDEIAPSAPAEFVRRAQAIDTSGYESQLRDMLRSAVERATETTAALYWEFDPFNDWWSGLWLCTNYNPLDAEWTGNAEGVVEGPRQRELAALYAELPFDAHREALEAVFYARSLAAFGRAYKAVGFNAKPVVASLHDSGFLFHMPRPGVDLWLAKERELRKRKRLPSGKWLWLTPSYVATRPRIGSARDRDDERRTNFLRLAGGVYADVQPCIGRAPIYSDRMKTILEERAAVNDGIEFDSLFVQSEDGKEERAYWAIRATSVPDVVDLDRCDYDEGWRVTTVVFSEEKLRGHEVIGPMRGALIDPHAPGAGDSDAGRAAGVPHAVMVSRRTAREVALRGLTGIAWTSVLLDVPDYPPHLMAQYGRPSKRSR